MQRRYASPVELLAVRLAYVAGRASLSDIANRIGFPYVKVHRITRCIGLDRHGLRLTLDQLRRLHGYRSTGDFLADLAEAHQLAASLNMYRPGERAGRC